MGAAAVPLAATTTTTTVVGTTRPATVRVNEFLSRQRWAAIALALTAALALLVLMLWVWLKDRCTSDGDCSSLCPRSDVPCTSRCDRGRCTQSPVSCTQPGQAWCPVRRACIDTRTEVCAAPGTVQRPAPGPGTAPSPSPPPSPSPLPLPARGGGAHGAPPRQGQAQPCGASVAALLPVLSQCVWDGSGAPQTVGVNGVTYVVDPAAGTVQLIDDEGRPWECGADGRWWYFGPMVSADGDYGSDGGGDITCWDQSSDFVWSLDTGGSLWAAPRKGGSGWAPCDGSGASAVAPPPRMPVNPGSAAQDVARGRASAIAAAAAAAGQGAMQSPPQ